MIHMGWLGRSPKVLFGGALVALVGLGCSHTLPQELADARTAYARAAQSPGAPLVPGDMADARSALNAAERQFTDTGGDRATRDLAYIADRRAISAGARAEMARAMQQKQIALADLEAARRMQAARAAAELDRTRSALSSAQQRADSERQARIVAEQNEQDVLSKIKDLKTELNDRGLVLTISGQVLFATGKSILLPIAQQRLAAVARALKDDPRTITIVGHTDNTGKKEMNQRLSEDRADAVKKFLAQQGVPESHLKTMGMGETQPISSNASPEGRANNRRVEIVVAEEGGPTNPNRRIDQTGQKGKRAPTDSGATMKNQ
jgi:outer membrane protein OmpA-like peptidoglycan-associated protein